MRAPDKSTRHREGPGHVCRCCTVALSIPAHIKRWRASLRCRGCVRLRISCRRGDGGGGGCCRATIRHDGISSDSCIPSAVGSRISRERSIKGIQRAIIRVNSHEIRARSDLGSCRCEGARTILALFAGALDTRYGLVRWGEFLDPMFPFALPYIEIPIDRSEERALNACELLEGQARHSVPPFIRKSLVLEKLGRNHD